MIKNIGNIGEGRGLLIVANCAGVSYLPELVSAPSSGAFLGWVGIRKFDGEQVSAFIALPPDALLFSRLHQIIAKIWMGYGNQ
jgi:hypothetical protein